MPFNVCDKNGNHVGFIVAPYFQYYNVFKVAITTGKIEDEQIDINAIRSRVAGVFGCKNVLGKVNNEKFQNTISLLLEGDYSCYRNLSSTDFLKFLALDKLRDIEEFIGYSKENINGYILVDIDKLHFQDGTAIMDETVDYIFENKVDEDVPIYTKIMDYPIINTNAMGIAEGILLGADFSDFGGRNHTHTTVLNVISGNFITKIELPAIVYAKKDMIVNLYADSDAIRKVFCDGILYKF